MPLDTRLFFVPARAMRMNLPMLERYGLTPNSPGVHALEYTVRPVHDPQTQVVYDTNTVAGPDEAGRYHVVYAVRDLPANVALGTVRAARVAEFDAALQRLDTLRIRPVAAIVEALAAGDTPPPADARRLSELEAIGAENRTLRAQAHGADSVEAVRAVRVWWPDEARPRP